MGELPSVCARRADTAMRFSTGALLVGLLGCARGFSDKPAPQTVVRDATERGAVCNDGTEAVYYFQKSASGSTRWVVHMKGGFWCWDAASCGARAPNLMGTATWPKSIYCPYPYKPTDPFYDLCTGAFNPDAAQNPLFHDANLIYMPYCSSDAWTGDQVNSSIGMPFAGKRILSSILSDVLDDYQSGLWNASEVLLSGTSAGGVGVLTNVDFVAELLPWAKVTGVMDSGWFLDVKPAGPCSFHADDGCDEEAATGRLVSVGEQMRMGHALWSSIADASCAKALPDARWQCLLGGVGFRYVSTPTVVVQHQFDCWQLAWNGEQARAGSIPTTDLSFCIEPGEYNSSQVEWVNGFRQATQASLRASMPSWPAGHGLFSTTCFSHGAILTPMFATTTIGGKTLQDVVAATMAGAPLRAMDLCKSANDSSLECTVRCFH